MTLAVSIAQGGSNNVTMRNKIINGAMMIDQRNAGASYSQINGGYSLDRWAGFSYAGGSVTGKYTVQQNAGSVTPPAGFTNYLGVTSSAATSLASTDIFTVNQTVEGYNVADLNWGTANAKTITISFWVRASIAGTYGILLRNDGGNRAYSTTYTISSTNTWEQKTVTIPGDQSGTWLATNGAGIIVLFQLQVGSTYTVAPNSWGAGNLYGSTGCVSLLATSGATFYITGVQLEAGTTATPFEQRLYGTELALCQRYYEKSYNIDVAPGTGSSIMGMYEATTSTYSNGVIYGPRCAFSVTKRATPTMKFYNYPGAADVWEYARSGSSSGAQAVTGDVIGQTGFSPRVDAGGTAWVVAYTAGHWTATSEL